MPAAKRGDADVQAFCRALWRHDEDAIAALQNKVAPNGRDRWGYTPLTMAARYADAAVVKRLLARGADVDQARTHLTPITYAAARGAAEIVTMLRAAGAHESIVTHVYLGDRKRVAAALKANPALARLQDEEKTPIIHHAAAALAPAIVTLLLDGGAEVDELDAGGETALHKVGDLRSLPGPIAGEVATLLLDRKAAVDARNWDQVTPLHQAVRARNLAVVEVLLARGADPNARDKGRGSTPLRRAVTSTGAGGTAGTAHLMLPLATLLLEHGADAGALDARGVPVWEATRDPVLRALLEQHGAGPKKRGAAGRTTPAKKPRRKS